VNAYSYIKDKVFTKLQPSKTSGVGVFALRDIPKDTNLFELWQGDTGYHPVSEEQLKELPTKLYSHIKDIFLYSPDFPKDTNTYVYLTNGCHWIYTTPYYFVNSGLNKANIDKQTKLSLRDIHDGEEILSNYGRYERFSKKDLI
jgi:SET domain-containing protein